MAHRTDEASVVPAEPQRLQEPVPSIDLEVTAAALGAKHLLVVCEERQSPGQHSLAPQPIIPGKQGWSTARSPQAQPGDNSLPAPGARCLRHPGEMLVSCRVAPAATALQGGGKPHLPGCSTRL